MQDPSGGGTLRFSVFEMDMRSGELRKRGVRVPLQQQPFRILLRLVERPGDIVTREALRRELWPDDTYVDFEQGINATVKRLREALGDSAETPRFIETLPKRGYRFIAPINSPDPSTSDVNVDEGNKRGRLESRIGSRRQVITFVIGLAAISGAAAAAFLWAARGSGSVSGRAEIGNSALVRLTSNPADMSVTSAHISPDGRHLAFADPNGLQVRMIDGGTTHRLAQTEDMNVYGWTSDSTGVLASQCDALSCSGWVISLIGQERHRTGAVWPRDDPVIVSVRMSPDGQRLLRLAFSMIPRTLLVDPMNGASAQRLATGDIVAANWSPDGKRILFVRRQVPAIESVPADGGTRFEVYRAPKDQVIVDAIELPDRSILFTMMPPGSAPGATTEIELWKAATDQTGKVREPPRRLTWAAAGASHLNHLSASANGERVTFLSTSYDSDIYIADGDLQKGVIETPRRFTVSNRNDTAWQWTTDSRAVILSSTRNGSSDVFKQALDSEVAQPLATGPGQQDYAGVSSDGRWLLYMDGPITGDDTVMRVQMAGGVPAEVVRLVGSHRLQCALRGRCVLMESKGDSRIISSLDPLSGKGRELARMPSDTSGSRILPDGDAFSYILPAVDGVRNRVRVISFNGEPSTDIVVKGVTALGGLSWLPSGSGFLSHDGPPFRGRVLLISRDGASTKVLWAPSPPLSAEWGIPSPDEKHVAFNALSRHSNAWMVSGF